ncbi:hypothetical protein OROHE_007416 [Orobanche hederae]
MAANNTTTTTPDKKPTPKKANLLDHHSIKHILDESVSEIVTGRGYGEDVRMSNVRLFIGLIIIVIALFAQFYHKKFPENKNFLIGCTCQSSDHIHKGKERNSVYLSSCAMCEGSFNSTGLIVSSKLPRFSDMYTLNIASADPKSISARPTVEFTKSVTQWFTKEGVLVEGLFWKDVEGLINDYAKEHKKGN